MSSKTWLWLPFISLILTNLSAFATAQPIYNCYYGSYNYSSNSAYNTNRNTLLSSLSSNMDNTGFHNASAGQNPDRVHAIALCRGDVQPDSCRDCVHNATVAILNSCPNQKQAVLYTDFCMLGYSNESIFGLVALFPQTWWHGNSNVSSPDQFKENLRTLVDDLRGQAASGGPLMKVAAGNHTAPDFQTIFALLQCTPDISEEACSNCLRRAAEEIPICCDNARWARIQSPSCQLIYSREPFYNITRVREATVPVTTVPVTVPAPAPTAVKQISPPPGKSGSSRPTRTIIIIVVLVVVCLILAAFVGICLRKRIKRQPDQEITSNDEEITTVESLQYDFGKIRSATDDFSDSNKLGQGGFGVVYKGKLQNGQEIAVKRLSRSSEQGDLEFKNEVVLVAKLQHRNLVRLLGFALEGTERLLVYEFVRNASLDRFIFDPIKRSYIDWDKRYKIIGGIARGLLYLHEDSRFRIIHRDLKASNILLDGGMNPKIADFGMARLFVQDESQGSTSRIVGTYGYMSPEYAMHGQFSVKSDVFSFGVLVLEIVSGQKNNAFRNGENVEDMLSFAWRNWREGTATNMIDPVLRSSSGPLHDMLRCIHIGLLCVQENAVDRPTMASIVIMLNSFSITLPVPSQPAFFKSSRLDPDTSLLQKSNSRELEICESSQSKLLDQSTHFSKNDASITELYPR